jgi:hypothetical protein
MATLYPPPSKRQKVAQAEKAREQQEIQGIPSDLGSVRVQFYDQATGNATGPAVSVPVADANVKNLETLLNTLQGNVRNENGIAVAIGLFLTAFLGRRRPSTISVHPPVRKRRRDN